MRLKFFTGFAVCMAVCLGAAPSWAQIATYNVRPDRIFIAGISSGGYMAVQLHIAYSHLFKGAAIYAAGPDDCAQGSVVTAIASCEENTPPPSPASLEATLRGWAKAGGIDPLADLSGQLVYVWSGRADAVVLQPVVNDLVKTYQNLKARVFRYDNNFVAGHGWETPDGSVPCAATASPFLNQCSTAQGVYDSERVWLHRLFGNLAPRHDGTLTGSIVEYDQNVFAPGGNAAAISMDNDGYAFVPADCAAGASCGLVLALHGCNQSVSAVGMDFIQQAGLNEWADGNHFIVLYPQAIPFQNPTDTQNSNPQGCWNWWGYLHDSATYAQQSGVQMQALHALVAKVSGHS